MFLLDYARICNTSTTFNCRVSQTIIAQAYFCCPLDLIHPIRWVPCDLFAGYGDVSYSMS